MREEFMSSEIREASVKGKNRLRFRRSGVMSVLDDDYVSSSLLLYNVFGLTAKAAGIMFFVSRLSGRLF